MLDRLVLISLASAYLTYVIARSEFPPVEAIRVRVFERFGEGSAPAYLATCTWCVSAYASAIVVLLTTLLVDQPEPVLIWPAGAMGSALLNDVHDVMTSYTNRGAR